MSNGQLLRLTWLFGNNELKYHGHSWSSTIASESISPLWWCVDLPDGIAPGLRSPAFFSFIYASIPLFCWLDLADLGLVLPCWEGALPTAKSPPLNIINKFLQMWSSLTIFFSIFCYNTGKKRNLFVLIKNIQKIKARTRHIAKRMSWNIPNRRVSQSASKHGTHCIY